MFNLSKDKGFYALIKRADLDAETKALVEQGADYATIRKSLFENMHPGNITTYRRLIQKADEEEEKEKEEEEEEEEEKDEEEDREFQTQVGGRSNIGGEGRSAALGDATGPAEEESQKDGERNEEAAYAIAYADFEKMYRGFATLRDNLIAIKQLADSLKVTVGDTLSGYEFSNVSAFRSLKKSESNTIFNFMNRVRNNPNSIANFEDKQARIQTFFVERDEESQITNMKIKPPLPPSNKSKKRLEEIDVSRLVDEYKTLSEKEFSVGRKTIDFLEAYEGLHVNRFNSLPSGKESISRSKKDVAAGKSVIQRLKNEKSNIKRRGRKGLDGGEALTDLEIAIQTANELKKLEEVKKKSLSSRSDELKERQIYNTEVLNDEERIGIIALKDAMSNRKGYERIDKDSPEFEKYVKAVKNRISKILEDQLSKLEEIDTAIVSAEKYTQLTDEVITLLEKVESNTPTLPTIGTLEEEMRIREKQLEEEEDKENPDQNKIKYLNDFNKASKKYLDFVQNFTNGPLVRKMGYQVKEVKRTYQQTTEKYKSLDIEEHGKAIDEIKSTLIFRSMTDLGRLADSAKDIEGKVKRISLANLMKEDKKLRPLLTDRETVSAINSLDKYIVACDELDTLMEKVEQKNDEMVKLEEKLSQVKAKGMKK